MSLLTRLNKLVSRTSRNPLIRLFLTKKQTKKKIRKNKNKKVGLRFTIGSKLGSGRPMRKGPKRVRQKAKTWYFYLQWQTRRSIMNHRSRSASFGFSPDSFPHRLELPTHLHSSIPKLWKLISLILRFFFFYHSTIILHYMKM